MQKFQRYLNITILATEASHVFCCVLPTIFSLLSLLAGIGLIGAIPPGIQFLHDNIHNWELPIIMMSGLVLVVGWWVHDYSKKIDCHDHGCGHGPCGPKKKRSAVILKVASILFLVNVSVYFLAHRSVDVAQTLIDSESAEMHEEHGHN